MDIQVKIIKCSKPSYWYHNMIGEVITVMNLSDDDEEYWTISTNEDEIEFIYINKDDAIPFDRRKKINKILGNM